MAGRAMRRKLQEQNAIPIVAGISSDESEEETANPVANAFSGLMMGDTSDEDNQSEEVERNKDKEKEHKIEVTSAAAANETAAGQDKKKKKKKKKKKNKKAQESGTEVSSEVKGGDSGDEEELDEIDRSLKEISEAIGPIKTRGPDQATNEGGESTAGRRRPLLTVERRFLSPEAEIKRLFGNVALRGDDRRANARDHRSRTTLKKTVLATPKVDWPKIGRTGITMEQQTNTSGPELLFSFTHTSDYQETQMAFFDAVRSMDPNNITAILQAHPYHIDSLLQLSEILKINGELQTSADMIERALFCFECSFHTMFNMSAGNCELDYNCFENRGFFLALFRHARNLGNRGCWRTAFEFSKLLFSLSPFKDPLGVVLGIDYFALRANENEWVIQLAEEWGDTRHLFWLPNILYSMAFAERQIAVQNRPEGGKPDLSRANLALRRALIRFPEMVNLLAEKCGATMHPDLARHKYFSVADVKDNSSEAGVRVLTVLYAWRAYELWKPSEILEWLQDNALALMKFVEDKPDDQEIKMAEERRKTRFRGVPRNIIRHLVISECDEAKRILPKSVKANQDHACDPVAPEGVKSVYDELREKRRTEQSHGYGALEMFLRSMVPGFQQVVANEAQTAGNRGGRRPQHQEQEEGLARLIDMIGLQRVLNLVQGDEVGDDLPEVPDVD